MLEMQWQASQAAALMARRDCPADASEPDRPCCRAMSAVDQYTVIVTQIGGRFGAWQYEIHRDGRPLPARVRDTGFKTRYIAKLAGDAAQQDFLLGLAQEQRKA
jgi:hypothetical protein